MRKSNKANNTLLLLTGAIAGAAAAYFLNTPKGKQMRSDIYNRSIEAKDEISQKAQILAEEVKDKSQEVMSKASDSVAELQEKFSNSTSQLQETAESKISSFQKGVIKAKETLMNNVQN